MIEEANGSPSEPRMDLSSIVRRLVEILRRRWLTVATIVLVIFGAALITVMLLVPKYEAVARIKIDPSRSAAMGQLTDQSSIPDQSIVDTEVSAMQSLDIAQAVVRKLGLDRDPEFTRGLDPLRAGASAEEVDAHLNQVAGNVLKSTAATRERSTYIIEVATTSVDPIKAARVANMFAEEYIEASLGRRSDTAERQASYLEKRLNELSGQATTADSKLAEYRAQAGVISSGPGSTTVTDQQMAPLANQLATAQSEAAAAAAKVRAAESQVGSGGLDSVSAVLTSDVIRGLRSSRAQILQEQGEILTRYGPKHPETQKITQQLESIDQQIDAESRRIIAGLRSDATSASARAQSLASDLGRLRSQQARDTRSSAMADTYQRQADSAQAAYERLAEKAQASAQAAGSSILQAQIIEKATPPSSPSKPNKGLLLALGFIVAVATGLGAVTILEVANTGLLSIQEVQNLGIPVLATIPRLLSSQKSDGVSPVDLIVEKPVGSYAEAYRTVRSALILGRHDAPKVIAVASTLPDEGKTTTSLSLARIMALAGERTIVIDCDLRRAGLTKVAGITAEAGLVEVLRGEVPLRSAIVKDTVEGLDILPLSASFFSSEDMFSGDAMASLLTAIRRDYDHVLLDTPPLLGIADARTLVTMADAVTMVIKWNATPRNAVRAALEILHHDQANVAGAVLSMVDPSSEAYGALYYSEKYAEYYGERKR